MNDSPKDDPIRYHGGFADLLGYELTAWGPDTAELTLKIATKHLNRSGVVHGGVVTTLIDTACSYSGCFCSVAGNVRRSFSLSLTTQFIGLAREGAVLTARARRIGGGRTIFFADCELRDQDGTLIGKGEGSFKYRRGSESPVGHLPEPHQPVG